MDNIFEKKVILETSAYELEEFVNGIYGGDLSVALIEGGDGEGTFNEEIKIEDIHSYKHQEDIALEIASGNYMNVNGLHEILLTLLKDLHIEEGEYIICDV